jgi:hypothetical protein
MASVEENAVEENQMAQNPDLAGERDLDRHLPPVKLCQ